jgi:hypothetical protein
VLREGLRNRDEDNSMQDLMQSYVTDLKKLRDVFHGELTATAEELSKAMALYAQRSDAALASFMERVSARGLELEALAAARLNQFCGLPANGGFADVESGPHTPTHADVARIAAAAERAVADGQLAGSDGDRKPQPGRSITRLNQGRPPESSQLPLQEGRVENRALRTSDGSQA